MADMMTDTELLDALQELNNRKLYTGKCVLRISDDGRGWRLHETTRPFARRNVRNAIEEFVIRKRSNG